MPPIKSTKYISSKVKNKPVINAPSVICYEPYLDCINRPTFSVEVAYCYTVKSPSTDFDEEKYIGRITVRSTCNSPKEAVDYAMSTWEDEAKKEKNVKTTMFNVYYDFRFINVVRVSVQIKNDYWE